MLTHENMSAGLCVNSDGRPICPPSRVLCRECLDTLDKKLRALLIRLTNGDVAWGILAMLLRQGPAIVPDKLRPVVEQLAVAGLVDYEEETGYVWLTSTGRGRAEVGE